MANLEDKFLRANVPGRWSTLDGYDQEDRERKRENEEYDVEVAPVVDEAPSALPVPQYRDPNRTHFTGAKGVLADYKEAQMNQKLQRQQEQILRNEALRRITEGARIPVEPEIPTEEQVEVDSDDDLLDDDDFMAEYRQRRIEQLQTQQQSTRKLFGTCNSVTASTFVNEIEEDPGVTVVVHIYEVEIPECVVLNALLDTLAKQWSHIKFIRMLGSANGVVLDQVAFPTLSIYRDGEVVSVITEIAELLGVTRNALVNMTVQDVMWILESDHSWQG